jgi:hypothetical protein
MFGSWLEKFSGRNATHVRDGNNASVQNWTAQRVEQHGIRVDEGNIANPAPDDNLNKCSRNEPGDSLRRRTQS